MKVVLHTSYGGFHLTKEIVEELNKLNFPWKDFGNPPNEPYSDNYIYTSYMNDFSFRSHSIFVNAIENLQKIKNDMDRIDYRKLYVSNLTVKNFELNPHIEDYHDGKEKLMLGGQEIY